MLATIDDIENLWEISLSEKFDVQAKENLKICKQSIIGNHSDSLEVRHYDRHVNKSSHTDDISDVS